VYFYERETQRRNTHVRLSHRNTCVSMREMREMYIYERNAHVYFYERETQRNNAHVCLSSKNSCVSMREMREMY